MDFSLGSIHSHLHFIGKVYKHGRWVPHNLSAANKAKRLQISRTLIARHEEDPFLDRIVTGDEKWILYANVQKKRQWVSPGSQARPTPKAGLHPRKVMLCVWWDTEGIVHFEFLPRNQTITAQLYAEQLDRVNQALLLKRPHEQNFLLLHDNARLQKFNTK